MVIKSCAHPRRKVVLQGLEFSKSCLPIFEKSQIKNTTDSLFLLLSCLSKHPWKKEILPFTLQRPLTFSLSQWLPEKKTCCNHFFLLCVKTLESCLFFHLFPILQHYHKLLIQSTAHRYHPDKKMAEFSSVEEYCSHI